MPMSSAGRAVNSNGCVTKPKECGIGLRSCFVPIQSSSLTGSYVMATAEQWEPYESRGSRTVLGEPGGESPPGHSSFSTVSAEIVGWLMSPSTPVSVQPGPARKRCAWPDPCDSSFQTGGSDHA